MAVTLSMLKEQGAFNMSFVIRTENGRLIVVDGGMTEDTAHLLEHIGGQTVGAWFLTHPHHDHITAFMDIAEFHPGETEIRKVYYNFPTLDVCRRYEPEEAYTAERFYRLLPKLGTRAQRVYTGDVLEIDGVRVEILFHCLPDQPMPPQCMINSTSLVVQMKTGNAAILFLGDCDPTSGDILLETQREKLKSDYVQMAHHGHSGVSCDVYMEIDPEACLWCAPEWLYNEAPEFFGDRLYGTIRQRQWMEKMGVKKHYVSGFGDVHIRIP